MRLVASGVETCLSHAQLSLDTHLHYMSPPPVPDRVLHTTMELPSTDEHVRIQASLRHAMAQDDEQHACVTVICTVLQNPKSGDKRKASNVNTVTYVLVEL